MLLEPNFELYKCQSNQFNEELADKPFDLL